MSVAQLVYELNVAKEARDAGKITPAEYNTFAIKQAALISQATSAELQNAVKTQSSEQKAIVPSESVPKESVYYTRPQIQATLAVIKDAPEVLTQIPKGSVITNYNPETKEVNYRTPEQEQAWQKSVSFYTDIGYPQFGGKYDVPALPSNQKVEGVSEVSVGGTKSLQFTLEQQQTQAGQKIEMPFSNGNLPLQSPVGGKVLASTPEGRTAAFVVLAPLLAPVAGVSVISVVGGEVLGGLFGAGRELIQTGQVSSQTVLEGALFGGVFAGVSGKVVSIVGQFIGGGVGKVVVGGGRVLLANNISPSAKVAGVAIETGINAGLGAGVNAGVELIERGRVSAENVVTGAAFGSIFTLGGRAFSGVNAKFDVTGKIKGSTVGRVQSFVTQKNLALLEQVDTRYQQSFNVGEKYKPSFKESLVMKATDLYPIRPNVQLLELPTVATSKVPDSKAFDMGIDIKTKTTGIVAKSARAVNAFEGDIILQRGEIIRIKNSIASDMADPGTSMYGKSMAPEDFYARETSGTSRTAQQKPQQVAKPNVSSLTDQGNLKINKNLVEENIFQTNKNVDEYLSEIGADIKEPKTSSVKAEPFEYSKKVEVPTLSAKGARLYGDSAVQLQPDIEVKPSKKPYMDPGQFRDAEALFSKNKFKQSDLDIVAELTLDNAAKPTGSVKVVSDILSGRAIDTSRAVGSYTRSYAQSSFNPKPSLRVNVQSNVRAASIDLTEKGSAWSSQANNSLITKTETIERTVHFNNKFGLADYASPMDLEKSKPQDRTSLLDIVKSEPAQSEQTNPFIEAYAEKMTETSNAVARPPIFPSYPRLSAPFFSLPGGGGGSFGGGAKRMGGVWFRRTHAIPGPKRLAKQMLGRRGGMRVRSLVDTERALTKSKRKNKSKRRKR